MTKIAILTVDEVLAIRKRLSQTLMASEDAFGSDRPIYKGKLESAVGRQTTGFGNKKKYNTVHDVAATLFYGLAMNHAFENGNKRTALVSALVLLQQNKQILVNTTEDHLFDLVTTMVKHELPVPDNERIKLDDREVSYVAQWLRERSRDLQLGDRHLRFRDFKELMEEFGCTFDDPDRNYIKIRRGGYSFNTGYPNANFDVDVQIIKEARRTLHLDEIHGIDSGAFYNLDGAVDGFVNFYRNLMRRLASA